ncbi:protein tyrosine phosphatase domain-containing protein 1-like isoform X2 [Varroa destructor]|nr:protein tyrosine phosphatase domain-containing protein 1-like isoform X2 [Varroa destructor]
MKWPPEQSAIRGLYSHWVTDDVLAMSRPTTRLLVRYDIVQQFQEHGIRAVFNLQSPGEHASCGNGLEDEGFSYKPMQLMEKQIFFYNFAWKDYGTLPKWTILDIVKVMSFSLRQGKIAVHCHAGLGRTGVLIACYLIYWLRCRANDAIRYVRLKRPGSIQTSDQILCVQEFAQYVLPLFVVFPAQQDKGKKTYTLWKCLEDQNKILHGLEQRHLRYIPRLVYHCCERLVHLATPDKGHSTASSEDSENIELNNLTAFYQDFIGATYDDTVWKPATTPTSTSAPSSAASQQQNTEDEMMVSGLKGLLESAGLYSNLESSDDSDVSDEEVYSNSVEASRERQSLLEKNVIYRQLMTSKAVRATQVAASSSSCANIGRSCLHLPFVGPSTKVAPSPFEEAHNNHEHSQNESDAPEVVELRHSLNEALLQANKDLRNYNQNDADDDEGQHDGAGSETPFFNGHGDAGSGANSNARQCSRIVAKCMLFQYSDLQPSFWVFIRKYKRALNEDAGAWERLKNEPNPCVVAALLWAFLESGLSDPVLSPAELTQIVLKPQQPASVLQTFPKGIRMTTEYLVRFLAKLDVDPDIHECLVQRLCGVLTHQKMACKGSLMPRHTKWPKMRDGTSKEVTRFINTLFDMVQGSSGSGRRWKAISSPDFSDHSLLNNNHNDQDHHSSSGGPNHKNARISTKTAINIVALAIAR